jgi:hypothetical protein
MFFQICLFDCPGSEFLSEIQTYPVKYISIYNSSAGRLKMRYANHYILSELLSVIETGDPKSIKREFCKYMARYKEDMDLCSIGTMAIYAGVIRNGTLDDIKARLKRMREIRRIETVKRCAELFSTQLSYR